MLPHTPLVYTGNSMSGTFKDSDLLWIEVVGLKTVHPGDVVIFRKAVKSETSTITVHRVRKKSVLGVVTQGDNHLLPDTGLVNTQNLIGRVTFVQRDGKLYPVWNGVAGRVWSVSLRLWRSIAPVAGWPYRFLRDVGVVRLLWQPRVESMHLTTEDGPLVKYTCGGRTVARWWPETGRFWCRKPYDLVIRRPEQCDAP